MEYTAFEAFVTTDNRAVIINKIVVEVK